jgi:cytochrome c oxidase subunit 6b
MVSKEDVKTVGFDNRFPHQNQTRHCWVRYNEYQKCISERGEDNALCTEIAGKYRFVSLR